MRKSSRDSTGVRDEQARVRVAEVVKNWGGMIIDKDKHQGFLHSDGLFTFDT